MGSVNKELIGKRLREARRLLGWSQKELAKRLREEGLRASVSAVSRWERGERTPPILALLVLAEELGVPTDFFLSPEVVSVKARGSSRKIGSLGQRLKAIAEGAIWAISEAGLELKSPPAFPGGEPGVVAERVRDEWSIGILSSLGEALPTLEANGVLCFVIDLPEGVSGASLRLNGKGFVFISRDITPQRQLFTLFHELGHILLHLKETGEFTVSFRDASRRPEEREANEFAGAALVPGHILKSFVKIKKPRTPRDWALAASELSYILKGVSPEAILTRALSLKLVSPGVYGEARKRLPQPEIRRQPLLLSPVVAKAARVLLKKGWGVGKVALNVGFPPETFVSEEVARE